MTPYEQIEQRIVSLRRDLGKAETFEIQDTIREAIIHWLAALQAMKRGQQ